MRREPKISDRVYELPWFEMVETVPSNFVRRMEKGSL